MGRVTLSDYKMNLMKDIISSESIVGLIDSSESGFDKDDPETLIYNNIFPYLRVPNVQTKAMTSVLIAVDKLGKLRSNPTFCNVRVTIWVLSHQEHMKVSGKNGNRIDLLSEEIEGIFRNSNKYGFGKVDNFTNREMLLSDKFIYREIVFKSNELITPTCGIGW